MTVGKTVESRHATANAGDAESRIFLTAIHSWPVGIAGVTCCKGMTCLTPPRRAIRRGRNRSTRLLYRGFSGSNQRSYFPYLLLRHAERHASPGGGRVTSISRTRPIGRSQYRHPRSPFPAHLPEAPGKAHGSCQSSNSSPGTRLNSCVLCVTKVQPSAKATAAMIKSFGPISVPVLARCARALPYSSAARSSKGRETNYCRSEAIRARLPAW